MTDTASQAKLPSIRLTETIFEWFLRMIALYCLAFGVTYWIRLIGFYEGSQWRFDLMPAYWQVAAVSLAVMFPFAAIGLWNLASWGMVVWFVCAAAETVMYAGFPNLFGARIGVVAGHVAVALFYVGFRVYMFLMKPRAED